MPRWGRRRRYKSKSKHQQHCLVMHTIFFTYKQLFSLFMRRYEEEELHFVITKRLYNKVCVSDAITTITFLKPKTGHTISNSRSSETKSILHFLARSWIFVLPTLYSNVKKIKVVAVDKKRVSSIFGTRLHKQIFLPKEFLKLFLHETANVIFLLEWQRNCRRGAKKLTRHELQINKKIRSKHTQGGSLFIPSSFDHLSQL